MKTARKGFETSLFMLCEYNISIAFHPLGDDDFRIESKIINYI